ncbi:hypothetical protein V5H41_29740, partial [Salmonella enterica]
LARWTFEPGMDFGASAWPQFIQGFAVACFFMPLCFTGALDVRTGYGFRRFRMAAVYSRICRRLLLYAA